VVTLSDSESGSSDDEEDEESFKNLDLKHQTYFRDTFDIQYPPSQYPSRKSLQKVQAFTNFTNKQKDYIQKFNLEKFDLPRYLKKRGSNRTSKLIFIFFKKKIIKNHSFF